MLDALARNLFHTLAGSSTLKDAASRYGMRGRAGFARRFIGGETLDEAIETARALDRQGFTHTLNYLGEHVRSPAEADRAAEEYLEIVDEVIRAGLPVNLSLKLTQLGLEGDPDACARRLERILEAAARRDTGFVRIDMENSPLVEQTLDIFERLWRGGRRTVGVVLQAALFRSEADLARVNALGARVRLVKGAYQESPLVAHQRKADVDAAFVRLMRVALLEGACPAIATHAPRMIRATRAWAREHDLARDRFEFQMLYGVRRDLQVALRNQAYPMRIYLPFGREWFPYFMRRLGERPANVLFVLRGLLHEQLGIQEADAEK